MHWLAIVGVALLIGALSWGVAAAWHATVSDTAWAPGEPGRGASGSVRPSAQAPSPSPTPTRAPDATFTIAAAGDVLPHLPVLASARVPGSYDFAPLLAPLDPWIQGADLALCHLEVPVAPPGVPVSGYPLFGTPPQIAAALRAQGWDGCSTASNHSLDRGFAGIESTLSALDSAGLGHVGTARTPTEAAQPQLYVLERAGQSITVAHLAVTYGTNGMPIDPDKPWSVRLADPAAIIAQAVAARAAGADLVVVSVHCCVEYQSAPTPEQLAIDQALADSGVVDVVFGHHAHVPQPIAKLAGGPSGAGMWVFYGLGNYLSNQDSDCCSPATDSGVLAEVTVVKPPDGPARVTAAEWTGVTVDRLGHHRTYALPAIAAGAGTLSAAEVATRTARVASAVGAQAPERTSPEVSTGPPPTVVPRTP